MPALADPKGYLQGVSRDTRQAIEKLAAAFYQQSGGYLMRVRSGRRTCAEQAEQWAIGRSRPGEVVTHAEGCRSWHVLARAVDIDILKPDGKAVYTCDPYALAGAIWKAMGGVWGGSFTGFGPCGDQGHYEWHPGLSMATLCPDPSACSQVEASVVQESVGGGGVPTWLYAAGGMLLVGVIAWKLT